MFEGLICKTYLIAKCIFVPSGDWGGLLGLPLVDLHPLIVDDPFIVRDHLKRKLNLKVRNKEYLSLYKLIRVFVLKGLTTNLYAQSGYIQY